MTNVYSQLEKVFLPRGIRPPFHWASLTRKQKQACRKDIVDIANNSQLKLNVFCHQIKPGMSHKDYFLVHLPNCISENLESWIKSMRKDQDIDVIVDDDYNIRHVKNGT